jgi:phosphoenolpyruvate phosphomutase
MNESHHSLATLLDCPEVTRFVGARDPLTAILAEQAGFDGVWVSSLETSATRGLPDLGLLTMTECLADATAIRKAVTIPALVDCDTGYGGQVNVRRTVREFAAAGISGICLEDKVFPKRNSFLDGEHALMPRDEFAQAVATAKRER